GVRLRELAYCLSCDMGHRWQVPGYLNYLGSPVGNNRVRGNFSLFRRIVQTCRYFRLHLDSVVFCGIERFVTNNYSALVRIEFNKKEGAMIFDETISKKRAGRFYSKRPALEILLY